MATKNKSKTAKQPAKKAAAKKGPTAKRTAAKKVSKKSGDLDEQFPGYPRYGAGEDITSQSKRVDENLDDEILTQVKHKQEPKPSKNTEEVLNVLDDEQAKSNGKYDVTDEDLEALGPKDLSMDMGDDEQLKHRNRPVDFTGEDLDVPGTELDDDQEERGSEDEENNIYSLGGDDKNNLDEGQEHERSL